MNFQVVTAAADDTNENTGIGDGLVALPFVYGLRRKHPGARVKLLLRGHQMQLCSTLYDDCQSQDTALKGATIPVPEGTTQYRTNHTGFWSREDEAADLAGTSRLGLICKRFEVEPSFDVKPTVAAADVAAAAARLPGLFVDKTEQPIVVLAPGANKFIRAWPLENFVWLAQDLKRLGYRVIVIGNTSRNLEGYWLSMKVIWMPSLPPVMLLALLKSAALFVGNDSGLTHLAGLLGTPAIGICGVSRGHVVFGGYPTVTPLQAPKHCTGCHLLGQRGWVEACSASCRALLELPVRAVLSAALTKLNERLN